MSFLKIYDHDGHAVFDAWHGDLHFIIYRYKDEFEPDMLYVIDSSCGITMVEKVLDKVWSWENL